MLTALVVDPSPAARRRIAALLRLGGWQVAEVPDAERALLAASGPELDLVVTEVVLPGQTGLALLSRLREAGSRARFLVVTTDPSPRVSAAASSVGALACLAKPVDPRAVISFLSGRTSAAAPARPLRVVREVEDLHEIDIDADTMDRLQAMFVSALPYRLSLIAEGARVGDAMAVASAAQTLGGASGQLGHPEIAAVCRELAAAGRRGVVAHGRLADLQALSVRATRVGRPDLALPAGRR